MKVLLVRPHAPNLLSFTGILENEPLELEYLHTILKQHGYEDVIFDGMLDFIDFNIVLRSENPDIVCITGYISQENIMLNYAKKCKDFNGNIVTILGGCHVQLNYERFYHKYVDFLSRSECMTAFIQLIKHIDPEVLSVPLKEINGLGYKNKEKSSEFTINPLEPTDINSLPIPDRSYFYKKKEKFRYLDLTEVATIKTAFSCPYDCNFCYCTQLSCGKYAVRDLNLVIEEIKGIHAENIQIVDDDFMVDRERLISFANLLTQNNIKKTFTIYARADFMAKNPDMVALMAEIGVKYFLVGLEAINDDDLNSFNKETTNEMNLKCIENIQKTTAECIGLFIIPINATPLDFKNLVNWVKKTSLNHATVSIFTPIPGTSLFEEYKEKLITDKVDHWDFLHLVLKPTNLSKSRFYLEFWKMYFRLYKISKKTGVYDFLNFKYCKRLIKNYFKLRKTIK